MKSARLLAALALVAGCNGHPATTPPPGGDGSAGAPADLGAAADLARPADVGSAPADGGASPMTDAAPDTAAPAGDAGAGSDPAPGKYGTRPRLPAANSEFALTSVGTRVYVLGGYPSSRVPQNALQIFDTTTGTWTLGAPYPTTIHHPVTVGVAGKLYSLGGQVSLAGQADTGRSFEYDPGANSWRELATMPTSRGGGGGVAIGDKIYVVGGRPPAGNAFEVYDVSDNAWTALPKLPAAFADRNHLAAAAINGKIYAAGGRYNGGSFGDPRTDALDMFDPAAGAWVSKKPMLRPRGGMSGVVAYGCFYVYGGEGQGIGEPNDVYPDHDVYNPRTDTWTALEKLAVPFHGVTGGAFVDGLIYMPGGGTTSGGSSGSAMHQVYRPVMHCE